MATPDLLFAFGRPPKAAAEYFGSKGYTVSWGWQEVSAEAHARAFTVAGVMKVDALKTIRDSLDHAIANGQTLEAWKKSVIPELEKHGLWGRHKLVNPETGEVKTLTPRRLDTIYRTNLQTSYMAGRYRALRDNVAERPWWRYVAVMDRRTRPSHRLLNGKTFRFDDPFWSKYWPPCGWNCRCTVRAINRDDLDASEVPGSGERLSESTMPAGAPGAEVPVTVPRFEVMPNTYVRTDPGFGVNPGEAAAQPEAIFYDRAKALFPREQLDRVLQSVATAPARQAGFEAWVDGVAAAGRAEGRQWAVGFLNTTDEAAAVARGAEAGNGTIVLEDRLVVGKKAARHAEAGNALSMAEWKALPAALAEPEAVLWDRVNHTLVYVMPVTGKVGKIAVQAGRVEKGARFASVRTAFKVPAIDLIAPQYELLRGVLDEKKNR